MFSPARVTSSPIDEAQLTGKRKTHMKALIEGSSQVLIEDDYKESEDPHRLLQERWTGETWFEISSAQASSGPQKRAPKLSASKAVKKKAKATPLEGEDTAANETTGSGAIIPMPDDSLQEALRERGPDAVDGIPGTPVSPGLPSPSVFLKVDHLDSTEESRSVFLGRISLRCATPQGGAAPNLFDVSGWWSLALVVQGGVGRSVRSRLLPVWPQRDGALPVAVTPQLARPLVLVPVGGGKTGPERMVVEGGEVQLGLDLTVARRIACDVWITVDERRSAVRAVLTLGALLVGSSRLPGHVALQLPEGLQLLSADGCSATGCCSCHVPLDASAVRLQADGLYPLTLQLRAPHAPVPTTWRLELHSAGPWQVSGVTESVGVKFTFGTYHRAGCSEGPGAVTTERERRRLIPSTWSHFPVLHATPPILGDTLLVVTFRPYTSGAGHVVLVGPETAGAFVTAREGVAGNPHGGHEALDSRMRTGRRVEWVLRCRRLALRALSEAPGPPSEWRCWAPRERYVEITVLPEEFSPAVTYRLELEVQHLPGSWVPDEEDQASLFGNASEATPWWRLSFEDVNHTRLATARWIPGYPLWPETFDLALDYLNLPLSLSPGAKSTLAVTISSFQALGLPVYVRLYAPEQVSLLCREGAVVLWPSRFTAAPTAHATCRGIGTLELVIWEALAPDTNYSFQATVTLPNSTNLSIDWWYVTLEAAGVRLGASAPQRPIVVPEAIQAEEDSDVVTTSSAADEDAPAADATEAADATVSELRVERLVVHEAENETTLGPWLLQQTWAETHELLALEILQIQVDGVPLGAVLSAGGSLKLHAPPGFTFPSPFDAASVRALGLAPTRSRVEGNGTATVLHFQDDVESVAMDVSVAVRWAPPEEEAVEPWRLQSSSYLSLPEVFPAASSCLLMFDYGDGAIAAHLLPASSLKGTAIAGQKEIGSCCGTKSPGLELWSASGKLLAAQGDGGDADDDGNIGSFDRTVPFRRLWVTSDVHVPGASFEVAVPGTTSGRSCATVVVVVAVPRGFMTNSGTPDGSWKGPRLGLDEVFFAMPAVEGPRAGPGGVAERAEWQGSLQDDVITAAAARPLPPGSCVASQNVLTLHLLSALQPAAVYGFPALARHGATREAPEVTAERVWFGVARQKREEVPWRPQQPPGVAGVDASDAMVLTAVVITKHLLEGQLSGAHGTQAVAIFWWLASGWLTPHPWSALARAETGERRWEEEEEEKEEEEDRKSFMEGSLLFVIFAVGSQAFPSSKLRLSWQTPSSSPSHRFMSCFWQQSLLRRQQWRSPWDLTQVPAVLEEEGTTASTADSLLLASFEGCTGGEEQVTLSLEAPLAPLKSYLLQLAVAHGPEAENATEAETLLTLEVLEDSQGLPRALARSADLRTYALAEEMTLTRWSYSSAFRSAENSLDLEFQPSKTTSESQATMLGFLLQAPPTFLFTQKSCEELVLQRSERVENLQLGRVESKALFLQGMPLCEVLPSPWLFEGGYYQHQLTVYLPPLVGFRQDFRYRVKVSVLNPPLPLDDPVMKRFLREKTSPKFSRSSYLAPALQTWRLSTFLWFSGDRGTGEVPYSLNQKGPLGRPGGLRKLEEVAWKGFEILT
ncbi:Hypothetical protein SCF082_LOCUS30706 [Durusdinium trenchii]|uniref:Uncharacterized protein n=1 Tax=Durusdinium trenchii TaxID=1381693 RepID=A0ABP0N4A5_9DINO